MKVLLFRIFGAVGILFPQQVLPCISQRGVENLQQVGREIGVGMDNRLLNEPWGGWDPCDNVFRTFEKCFSSDKERLNIACAYGNFEMFKRAIEEGTLTCKSHYRSLEKSHNYRIRIGNVCLFMDRRISSCFSSDKTSIAEACREGNPEKIGNAFNKLTMSCKSKLAKM